MGVSITVSVWSDRDWKWKKKKFLWENNLAMPQLGYEPSYLFACESSALTTEPP